MTGRSAGSAASSVFRCSWPSRSTARLRPSRTGGTDRPRARRLVVALLRSLQRHVRHRRRGMIRLAVVSGKGGTGKTVVTAGLAALNDTAEIIADCDVEAANLELLPRPGRSTQPRSRVRRPPPSTWRNAGAAAGAPSSAGSARSRWGTMQSPSASRGTARVAASANGSARPGPSPSSRGSAARSSGRPPSHGPLSHARLCPGIGNSGQLVQTVKRQARGAPGSGRPAPDSTARRGPAAR